MIGSKLTDREKEIIADILQKKGIREYAVVRAVPEGEDLPGSAFESQIELLSGTIVTETKAFDFWLDWKDDAYTFSIWREVDLVKRSERNRQEILEAQQRL